MHEEQNMVHEVMQEVGSRGKARYIKNSDQWFSKKRWSVD